MWKQWLIALVLVAVAVGGAFVYQNLDDGDAAQGGGERPASAVNTMLPQMDRVRDVVNAVGSLKALNAVELTTEVSGRVVELNLETGRRCGGGPAPVGTSAPGESPDRSAFCRCGRVE